MAVCGPHAIPHSIFLGGRLPGPGEVMWSDDDRAKQLAWQAWHNEHCKNCGTRREEWYDPLTGAELRDLPYEVVEVPCPGCELLEDERAERKEEKDAKRGAHLILRPVRGLPPIE